jgi:hypothetical protein
MLMPNKENALVEEKKIRQYLLNLVHKQGGPKANFFFGFGFSLDDIELFRLALTDHAITREVSDCTEDEFGVIYTLVCEFRTPDTRNPCIRTVWIVNKGEVLPRLVTAYPKK